MIRLLSKLTHNRLYEFYITPDIESSELLGCFEQVDILRYIKNYLIKLDDIINNAVKSHL